MQIPSAPTGSFIFGNLQEISKGRPGVPFLDVSCFVLERTGLHGSDVRVRLRVLVRLHVLVHVCIFIYVFAFACLHVSEHLHVRASVCLHACISFVCVLSSLPSLIGSDHIFKLVFKIALDMFPSFTIAAVHMCDVCLCDAVAQEARSYLHV